MNSRVCFFFQLLFVFVFINQTDRNVDHVDVGQLLSCSYQYTVRSVHFVWGTYFKPTVNQVDHHLSVVRSHSLYMLRCYAEINVLLFRPPVHLYLGMNGYTQHIKKYVDSVQFNGPTPIDQLKMP